MNGTIAAYPAFGVYAQNSNTGAQTRLQYTHAGTSSNSSGALFTGATMDLAGERTSLAFPTSGRIETTAYDSAGRISGVSGQLGSVTTPYVSGVQFFPNGGMMSQSLGNQAFEQNCQNNRLQTIGMRVGTVAQQSTANCVNAGAGASADLLNLAITYGSAGSNNGNVTAETTQNGSGFSGTQTYSVDAFNRLLNMTEVSGNAGQGYTYDQFGNRAVTSGYVPNNLTPQSLSSFAATTNRLLAPFTYDGMGNMTFDGLNTSVYDGENRLFTSSQTSFGTTTTLQYTYDPEGRRVQVQQTGGSGPNTVYVHDAAGSLIAEYSNAALPAAATLYLSTDHLGSTRLVTGAGASLSRCYDYLPFGEEIIAGTDGRAGCYETSTQTTTPDVTPVKFTGKERDSETGLDYFGARYFSAAQGRFTSPDEFKGGFLDALSGQAAFQVGPLPYADITDPQTLNKYAYVKNNPLRYTDPNGHCIEDLCIGEAILVTAAATATANYLNSPQGQESISATLALAGTALNKAADALGNLIFNKAAPNPNGAKGAPDHQEEVQKQLDKAQAGAKEGETVVGNQKIQGVDSTRRPDVQVVGADGKVKSVVEVERRPSSQRNRDRQKEYDKLGVPHETVPLPKKPLPRKDLNVP